MEKKEKHFFKNLTIIKYAKKIMNLILVFHQKQQNWKHFLFVFFFVNFVLRKKHL